MNSFKSFRKKNNLTQKQLSEYLEVGQGFVSQMEKGSRPIPKAIMSRLLASTEDWDVSMLISQGKEEVIAEQNAEEKSTVDRLFALIDDQREEIKALLELLKMKDEKIDELRRELDFRKEKIAQSAENSSSALVG